MAKKTRKKLKKVARTTSVPISEALNPRQRRFVAEYLIDQNASAAAIRAGYSPKTAGVQGHDLLKHPKIMRSVLKGIEALINKPLSEAQRVIQESVRLAMSDVRRVFDESGNLKNIKDLDDDIAAAVSSVEVIEKTVGKGEVEIVKKLRFWDKNSSLDRLARLHKLLTDKLEVDAKVEQKTEPLMLTQEELKARTLALLERLNGARA